MFERAEAGSISLFNCLDFNVDSGECLREEPKTVAELNVEKKQLIETYIASLAETTRARENITTAVVGKGTITKEK